MMTRHLTKTGGTEPGAVELHVIMTLALHLVTRVPRLRVTGGLDSVCSEHMASHIPGGGPFLTLSDAC